jgi:hypothetical protein
MFHSAVTQIKEVLHYQNFFTTRTSSLPELYQNFLTGWFFTTRTFSPLTINDINEGRGFSEGEF